MAEQRKLLLEAAGWGFFGVTFLLLVGPGLYLAYSLKYNDTSAMVWIGIGVLLSATVAAVLTTVANTIIQSRVERIRAAELEAERKKKKKKKKG